MALKNINPTTTESWKSLEKHFQKIKNVTLRTLFEREKDRARHYEVSIGDFRLDFSKNRIDQKTLDLLLSLAEEIRLDEAIKRYFDGEKINLTEDSAVLHTVFRNRRQASFFLEGEDILKKVNSVRGKMERFTKEVILGTWKGYTRKAITDVIHIGIGGSSLGMEMVVEALSFYKNRLKMHFISNIDGDHICEVIQNLNPETTLIIIVSKTFTTQETISNAITVKNWFLDFSGDEKYMSRHFVVVSANLKAARDFGTDDENIFPIWNWISGRFSLWSSAGLSIALSVGYENFEALQEGAYEMDEHFKSSDFRENIPVILALLGIWYNNFFKVETKAIFPYTEYLKKFPNYLQQILMESNGKSVDRDGNFINYQTGMIVWGDTGTSMQHAFMQLVHQGTKLIPCDFIGFETSLHGREDHHKKLMANFYAQQDALCFGKTSQELLKFLEKNAIVFPFKIFEGNRPSNSITAKYLTPNSLGKLIAMYEHKTFVQGIIWNIFSFDQFGVELGKEMAKNLLFCVFLLESVLFSEFF